MDLIKKKWLKFKGKNLIVTYLKTKIKIKNEGSKHGYIMLPKVFKVSKRYLNVLFKGDVVDGNSATFCVLTLKRELIGEITLNSDAVIDLGSNKKVILAIKVLGNTEVEIEGVNVNFRSDIEDYLLKDLHNDILVITPSYPTLENRYLSGFVHSRLKAYKEAGINFDVICAYSYMGCCKYSYEGIDVLRVPFPELRTILREKKYQKILVHFFDDNYANIFDACNLSESELFLWVHGPETLYWDWSKFVTGYFQKEIDLTAEQIEKFKQNDIMIKRYNDMPNVHWIFVSNWIKNQSEKLISIKFKQYSVIPNIINSDNFKYQEKNPELRKKIFFIRRFDDCNKYAIDVNVRTILELSRRDFFNDLDFNIYGTGGIYEELIAPLKKFSNVHFYPKFLNHEEIALAHQENGIGLFATRYDAQGVSMCEAAMSGLAIVTSDNEAIKEFLPADVALISDTEVYQEYADKIEALYRNPELFKRVSKDCHDSVYQKCSFAKTVKKEIDLISLSQEKEEIKKIKADANPLLSVIIPAYNVEKYIKKTLISLLSCANASKLEIIVVNDGSKDKTVEVVKEVMAKYNDEKMPIIKLIDKENGGHGSTINVGIRKATGKYVRIIDGDDWVNELDLAKLITKLNEADADIVITDYSEDLAYQNIIQAKNIYQFMVPGLKYNFDDLCSVGYGFLEWGPILATANFKTGMLQDTNFYLTEKSFYVDMEFDVYSIIKAKTVVYYPYNIYRYFIGRSNQSVSQESFLRNYQQHENILLKIIKFVDNSEELSPAKKEYLYRDIILPMAKSHYVIVAEYNHQAKMFRDFDNLLKKYPKVYYAPNINTKFIRLHRYTKGLLLHFNPLIKKLYKFIRRG